MSELSALWRHPEFRRGARDMTGISLGIAAWGLVTGVAAGAADRAAVGIARRRDLLRRVDAEQVAAAEQAGGGEGEGKGEARHGGSGDAGLSAGPRRA